MSTKVVYIKRQPVYTTVDGVPVNSDRYYCEMRGTRLARCAMTANELAQLAHGSVFFEVDADNLAATFFYDEAGAWRTLAQTE